MLEITFKIEGDEHLARLLAELLKTANSADSSKNILIDGGGAQGVSAAQAPKVGKRARGGAAKASCQCSLRDLICKKEHTEEIMGALGQLLRNAKGKRAALVILCAWNKGKGVFTQRPTFDQVKGEFGEGIGAKSGFNKYYYDDPFTKSEKESILDALVKWIPKKGTEKRDVSDGKM